MQGKIVIILMMFVGLTVASIIEYAAPSTTLLKQLCDNQSYSIERSHAPRTGAPLANQYEVICENGGYANTHYIQTDSNGMFEIPRKQTEEQKFLSIGITVLFFIILGAFIIHEIRSRKVNA